MQDQYEDQNLYLNQQINDIVNYINTKINIKPQIGIILGTGLGESANLVTDKIIIPYLDIPHLPTSSAPSHAGNLIIGYINNKPCILMQGRLHIYEGYSPIVATLLVRAMKLLGVTTLIITCAAGSLNRNIQAGGIVLIEDHINFSGTNPLLGSNLKNFGPRFLPMFDIYSSTLNKIAMKLAAELSITIHKGTYAAILGPMYASRAELRMYINNRCDVIGMSLVHEAIIAAHSGIEILALAAITDMALPDLDSHAAENEIIASGQLMIANCKKLFLKIIDHI